MAKRLAIYLFRNDLRVHDNYCLLWSHLNCDLILPLYCFDPRHFQETWHFGFPKTGPQRTKFLLESVCDLRSNLLARNSNLLIKKETPENAIQDLFKMLKNDHKLFLVFQEEVTKEEIDVERALKKICKAENVEVHTIWNATLYNKEDIPFKVSHVPDTYTGFRKSVESQCEVRSTVKMPDTLKPFPNVNIDLGHIPSSKDLGISDFLPHPKSAFPWKGGETSALKRVNYFLWESDKVAKYKETRNGLIGDDYSTKFSAWLSVGCLSPRFVYSEVKKYEQKRVSNQSTYWVIFELIWRDYFRYVALKYGDKMFYPSGIMGKHIEWKQDMKKFDLWKDGKTGVPFVDANMRELALTGWMSNRGRQNVASFLVKDLGIDWRLGAEWFESQLIDHDVCSNYGNWNYAAGIGNDPRENRKFNMIKQGLDYDPEGEFVRLWVPELAPVKNGKVHTPWTLTGNDFVDIDYPKPMVIAPEWSRQLGRVNPSGFYKNQQKKGMGNQRGLDFYFSNKNQPKK
ncbi:cryptochrome DASH-like [Artemia franciscana]|uniref:Cryptochrome DASH n=1 Tax=Artemia franciscana TaxID=6661 RepID=A0AA88HEY8_ARTSF|nr:hypothetical protein QYM36_013686 [Artemia franciscana]